MSTSAAIATVTYALKALIQREVDSPRGVAGTKVTSVPPDKARTATTGYQVNLFLYRVSIDPAWRNMDAPGSRPGERGQPPLPLILSYLVTAYGENDEEVPAHRLLGNAMSVLNDSPVLSRADIASITDEFAGGSGLDQQVELVKFAIDPRPQDELSRMWTTFGPYRLSVSYDASVVLIDSLNASDAPMPVLARGPGDTGPTVKGASPRIDAAIPLFLLPPQGWVLNAWGAARIGDRVRLVGANLASATSVEATGLRLAKPVALTPALDADGFMYIELTAGLPIPAGTIGLALVDDSVPGGRRSPAVPLAVAPAITNQSPITATLDANGNGTVDITCQPDVFAGQTVALIVGSAVVPAASPSASTGQISFALSGLGKGNTYPLRLRVDAVDSVPFTSPPTLSANVDLPDPIPVAALQPVLTTA
jgi:Pvc16 N-terminal domain